MSILDPQKAQEIWPEIFEILERAEKGQEEYVRSIAEKYGLSPKSNN